MAFPGLDVKWGGLVKKHTTISPVTFLKGRWVQNWHWNLTQNEKFEPKYEEESPIRSSGSNYSNCCQLKSHLLVVFAVFCIKYIFLDILELETFSELTREQIVICEADTDCSSQSIQILFLCLKVIYKTALMGQNMLFEAHLIIHACILMFHVLFTREKLHEILALKQSLLTLFNSTYAYVFLFLRSVNASIQDLFMPLMIPRMVSEWSGWSTRASHVLNILKVEALVLRMFETYYEDSTHEIRMKW